MKTAEVISIGDELTSGQRLDTNSQWISLQLGELGVRAMYHTTVADDLPANIAVFRSAVERADIVVASGGLGPTADDLTRDAVAHMAGVELVLDETQLRAIEAMFSRRGRPMPERNRVQALFPAGAVPIPNPNGTAPGIHLVVSRPNRSPCNLFCLPGVPAELFEMWRQTVAPAIAATMPEARVIRHRRIKCYGVGESHLEAMMPELIARTREPLVGITVSQATITLRITASGADDEACRRAMEPTVREIYDTLGTIVFGEEDDELQHAVARLLVQRGLTLATAEWGSAGLIARWLGEVSQGREHLAGGVVVASGHSAARLLGIDEALVARHGDTGREVATALATACREKTGADLALATSNVPPIDPTASVPPKFHIAIAASTGVAVHAARYAGHPDILKDRGGKDALNALRLHLLAAAD
ncbi:MAG: damage-inducible protein CinA [Planctomycetota bacterium]|nr:MAG: damage-inducible protein CinA [Planctomycetota bacterium]